MHISHIPVSLLQAFQLPNQASHILLRLRIYARVLDRPSSVFECFRDPGPDDLGLVEDFLLRFSVAGHAERRGRDELFEQLPLLLGAVEAGSESVEAGRSDLQGFDMVAFDVASLYGDAHGGWFLG